MQKCNGFHSIDDAAQNFLFDRKVQGFTAGTIQNYRNKLKRFMAFCDTKGISLIEEISTSTLREYLELLDRDELTVVTRHVHYAALKTFLRWFDQEEEPEGWINPITKLKPPKVPDAPIQPISMAEVTKIIDNCPDDFRGVRDKTILLILVDTGIRASELLNLNIDDYNPIYGSLLIRHGKGNKTRTVYVGKQTRRLLKRYLSMRKDDAPPLFISVDDRARLTYSGLRWVVINRSAEAKVKSRGIHTFRRLFALTMLRND